MASGANPLAVGSRPDAEPLDVPRTIDREHQSEDDEDYPGLEEISLISHQPGDGGFNQGLDRVIIVLVMTTRKHSWLQDSLDQKGRERDTGDPS